MLHASPASLVKRIALSAGCLLACVLPGPSGIAMGASPSGLELAACRLENPSGMGAVTARCGTLSVPEDPASPMGRRIDLHVAVVPALNRRPQPDPLFVLAGGPGQAASDFFAAYGAAFGTIGRDRDIVLVDQRGTGKSSPLNCTYPEDPDVTTVDAAELEAATRDCLRELRHDPRFYTTSIAVRDLDAVRAALGASQVNFYGVSYGTRVAQHYLRRYPARVRSVILDGPVPPQVTLGPDMAIDAQRALDAIFSRCTTDPDCLKRFPDLAARFHALRQRLQTPVEVSFPDPASGTMTALEFGVQHLTGVVRLLSYSDATAALLPLLIHAADTDNNFAPLAAQYVLIERSIDAQFAYGMHNAVVCTEDVPLVDRNAVDMNALRATYLGTASLDGLTAICSVWPRGQIDADLHDAMTSEAPVLILSGGNDPITPERYGEQVLKQFPRGRHIVIAGSGHGQLSAPCVPGLLSRFLAAGTAEGLDARCVGAISAAPFFMDFTGPRP